MTTFEDSKTGRQSRGLPKEVRGGLNRRAWIGLAVVAVLTALLGAPYLRNVAGFGDEGVILHGAERLLRGERLYRDVFEFLPPGAFLLVAGWFSLTGVSYVGARALVILVFTAIACLTYLTCHRVSQRPVASALVVIAWVVMSQGLLTQLSHHWLTTLFCTVTLWALVAWAQSPRRRYGLIILAGLAGGTAAFITPVRGAAALLAGLAAFSLLRAHLGALVAYCVAAIAVPAAMLAEVIRWGVLHEAFESVIVFAATRYPRVQGVPYGDASMLQDGPLLSLFPLAAILLALRIAQDPRGALGDHTFRVCATFATGAFVALLGRPDMFKIIVAAPLVLPLVMLCSRDLTSVARLRVRPAIMVAFGMIVMTLPVIQYARLAAAVLQTPVTRIPRGEDVRLPGGAALRSAVLRIAELPASERVFFYPYIPVLPFLTAREHPAALDILVPNYTTPEQYRTTCRSVIERAEWVVWAIPMTSEWFAAAFPTRFNPTPDEYLRFEQAIRGAFTPVTTEAGLLLMRRVPGADTAACESIPDDRT